VQDHISSTLSHKDHSDLTITYLDNLSEIQHSGRADHNMVNGQKLQPCLPVSQDQHLTDERVLDSLFLLCGFVSLLFLNIREREEQYFVSVFKLHPFLFHSSPLLTSLWSTFCWFPALSM